MCRFIFIVFLETAIECRVIMLKTKILNHITRNTVFDSVPENKQKKKTSISGPIIFNNTCIYLYTLKQIFRGDCFLFSATKDFSVCLYNLFIQIKSVRLTIGADDSLSRHYAITTFAYFI